MMTIYLFTVLVLVLSANNVQGQGRGSVRLFNQGKSFTNFTSGIVEIRYDNEWGPVCYRNGQAPDDVANTVCRQLGYYSGTTSNNNNYGSIETEAKISVQSCDSDQLNLLSCSIETSAVGCTTVTDNVAVQCYNNTFFDFSGKVRLVGQTEYTGEGRVEVYCNSNWGLICHDGFTSNDANTVCRQLGYTEGSVSTKPSYRNGNSGQSIWFNSPDCGSSEQCISSCTSCPSSSLSSCSLDNVAGVTCSYESNTLKGTYQQCLFADNAAIKGLVGIIIGCLIAFFICVALIIAIPIICCCCLGVGIGAAASRPKYSSI